MNKQQWVCENYAANNNFLNWDIINNLATLQKWTSKIVINLKRKPKKTRKILLATIRIFYNKTQL